MAVTEILLESGRIKPATANEARSRQEMLGGSVENHLLRLGAVTEHDLCEALRRHYGTEAVELSGRPIPESVLSLVPAETARERCVLPVTYDPSTGCLTAACLDPTDRDLLDHLRLHTAAAEVRLVAAAEPILRCRVVDAYRSVLELPDLAAAALSTPAYRGTILVLGRIDASGEALAQAIADENRRVVMADTIEDALAEIEIEPPVGVIIRDRRRESYNVLVDRLRKVAPSCSVRYAEAVADLIASDPLESAAVDLIAADLRLCLSLLCSDEELSGGGIDRFCRTVDRVCRRIDLPAHERLLVVNAAYLNELARLYLGAEETPDWEQAGIEPGRPGTAPVVWPPALTAILKRRDCDIEDTYPDRLPLPVLGANILRIAQYYCRHQDPDEPLTFDRYEAIKADLRRQAGTAFLPEVVEAFQASLLEDIELDRAAETDRAQVLILDERADNDLQLGPLLEANRFEMLLATTPERLVQLYERHWPEFIVVVSTGPAERAGRTIRDLMHRGIDVSEVPTFLLSEPSAAGELTPLLKEGVEDIIALGGDVDQLVVKLIRLRSRMEAENHRRLRVLQDMGTHGSLADMNVIDLLQAMGHAQKTVRISITARGSQLTMHLHEGQLVSAECDDLSGPEAVYEGLAWTQGIWSVDPISSGELPAPNNDLSIDSILIEGCHRLDETRRGHQPESGRPDELFSDDLSF